ncbi:MAG: hypothetical protein QOC67_3373, partial [Pseudonocardiales bacterium]|nr:hypothetical protein [Pseudonocardiales bacterium]
GVPNLIPPLASAPRAPGGPAAVDTGAPPRLAAPRVAEPARSGRRSRDTEGLTPRPTDFIDRHDDRAGDTSHGDGNDASEHDNDASEHDNDASEHYNDSDHASDNGGDSENGSDNGGNDDQTPRESRSPHHNGSRASSSDLLDAVLAAIERAWSGRG